MDTIGWSSIKKGAVRAPIYREERLREETRRGAVVVVRIVDLVRVELELVVVEVEDRGMRELVLVTRNLLSSVRGTGT